MKIGDQVKDVFTNIEGIITAIEPGVAKTDESPAKASIVQVDSGVQLCWFDEGRLELIKEA